MKNRTKADTAVAGLILTAAFFEAASLGNHCRGQTQHALEHLAALVAPLPNAHKLPVIVLLEKGLELLESGEGVVEGVFYLLAGISSVGAVAGVTGKISDWAYGGNREVGKKNLSHLLPPPSGV